MHILALYNCHLPVSFQNFDQDVHSLSSNQETEFLQQVYLYLLSQFLAT